MPQPLAENLFRMLWITDLGPFPAEHISFLKYHCLADSSRAKQMMGFVAKKTAWQALEEYLEVKRLYRVGRPTEPGDDEEESETELEEASSAG